MAPVPLFWGKLEFIAIMSVVSLLIAALCAKIKNKLGWRELLESGTFLKSPYMTLWYFAVGILVVFVLFNINNFTPKSSWKNGDF